MPDSTPVFRCWHCGDLTNDPDRGLCPDSSDLHERHDWRSVYEPSVHEHDSAPTIVKPAPEYDSHVFREVQVALAPRRPGLQPDPNCPTPPRDETVTWRINGYAVVGEPLWDPVDWDPSVFTAQPGEEVSTVVNRMVGGVIAEGDSPCDFEPTEQGKADAANRALLRAEIAAGTEGMPDETRAHIAALAEVDIAQRTWREDLATTPENPEDAYVRTRLREQVRQEVADAFGVPLDPSPGRTWQHQAAEHQAVIDAANQALIDAEIARNFPPVPPYTEYRAEVVRGKRRAKRADITGPFEHLPRAFHITPDHLEGLDILIDELNRLSDRLKGAYDDLQTEWNARTKAERRLLAVESALCGDMDEP